MGKLHSAPSGGLTGGGRAPGAAALAIDDIVLLLDGRAILAGNLVPHGDEDEITRLPALCATLFTETRSPSHRSSAASRTRSGSPPTCGAEGTGGRKPPRAGDHRAPASLSRLMA